MTGNLTLRFQAMNVQDAEEQALAEWRRAMDDPEADLHWSAHFVLTPGDDDNKFDVVVTIDFDDKYLTGDKRKPAEPTTTVA